MIGIKIAIFTLYIFLLFIYDIQDMNLFSSFKNGLVRFVIVVLGVGIGGSMILACGGGEGGSTLFGSATPKIVLNSADDLYQFLTYDEQRYPLVSAHRGGPQAGFPENALETFEFHASQQAIIIECDIRMTRDSVLILMHDETLDRTSTGTGRIADHSYAELQELFLVDPEGELTDFKIPTLDQALAWGKGKVVFTLDVKRDVPYSLVNESIQRNEAEAISVVITYSADQAMVVNRLNPDLMISASIRSAGDLLRLNDRNIPDNRLVAFVGVSEVDRGVYELLHGHGIMCIIGTMGNLDSQAARRGEEVYEGLIERGADILSTDRPQEAGAVLDKYRAKNRITSVFVP